MKEIYNEEQVAQVRQQIWEDSLDPNKFLLYLQSASDQEKTWMVTALISRTIMSLSESESEPPVRGDHLEPGRSLVSSRVEEAVASIAKNSIDNELICEAIYGLGYGYMGGERSIPVLTHIYETNPDGIVKSHAIVALGFIAGKDALKTLLHATDYQGEMADHVIFYAVNALARIAELPSTPPDMKQFIGEKIRAVADNPLIDENTRSLADTNYKMSIEGLDYYIGHGWLKIR